MEFNISFLINLPTLSIFISLILRKDILIISKNTSKKLIEFYQFYFEFFYSEIFPNEESRAEEERRKIDEDEIKEKEENSLELVKYKPSFLNKVWSYIQRLLKRFKL